MNFGGTPGLDGYPNEKARAIKQNNKQGDARPNNKQIKSRRATI
jgi:hypothetical protein